MAIEFNVDADLRPFAPDIDTAKANIMIADALAMAQAFAPCIFEDGFTNTAAAKAIIRGAILRWNDAGTGANTNDMLVAGPFTKMGTHDNKQVRKVAFWPSEINDLQNLCEGRTNRRAFTVDSYPVADTSVSEPDWGGWV
jgi:hypothetical protein